MTDELIAALEREVGPLRLYDPEAPAEIAVIRRLVADLRAGNLVRREEVVAHERERCARVADAKAEAIIEIVANSGLATEPRAAAHMACQSIAAAIRAGKQP